MRKVPTPTRFDGLVSGVVAKVRTGRSGPDAVQWSDPFETRLNLQHDARGIACGLTLQDIDFAEFDPRYDMDGDTLVSEDYHLEVLEAPLKD